MEKLSRQLLLKTVKVQPSESFPVYGMLMKFYARLINHLESKQSLATEYAYHKQYPSKVSYLCVLCADMLGYCRPSHKWCLSCQSNELSIFDDDDDNEIVSPDFPALTSLTFLAGPVPSGILLLYWKYLNSAVSLLSSQEQLFQIGPECNLKLKWSGGACFQTPQLQIPLAFIGFL